MIESGLRIGLTGAHRVGKSTIARELSEQMGLPATYSESSNTAADLGIDMTKPISFADRLRLQEEILKRFTRVWSENQNGFVSDRTPFDFMAYLYADAGLGVTSSVHNQPVSTFRQMCREVVSSYFDLIIYVPPVIPYKSAPGKPSPSIAYQSSVDLLIGGLIMREMHNIDCIVYCMSEAIVENDARVADILKCIEDLGDFGQHTSRLTTMH